MRYFSVGKLIRDRLPQIMGDASILVNHYTIAPEKYLPALKQKLIEEAQEVQDAHTKTAFLEELADVFEVITALGIAHGIHMDAIIHAASEKKLK